MPTNAPAKKTAAVDPIPPGMRSVTPHLVCAGAAAAIEFYKKAFSAQEAARIPAPDGKLIHAMVKIGDSNVMLVDEFPQMGCSSPQTLKGSPVTLHLYVPDADATFAQAIKAGAEVVMPLNDMFWGDRYGVLKDPFGHLWSVATHIRDASPDEIKAAAGEGCGG